MRTTSNITPIVQSGGTALNDDERQRLRHVELLLAVSQKLAALETLDEMLEHLINITTSEIGAERGTLFLNDPDTGELYSRIALGSQTREIRLMNNDGIAGAVFQTGDGMIIEDAYSDDRFNQEIDLQTGFKTKNILCAPIRTARGEIIGVAQTLNKVEGDYTDEDLTLLEAMATQAALTLQSSISFERMKKSREQELKFLDVVADVTSEIELNSMLQKVMGEATEMLNADRSTLFLNDEKTSELWSSVGAGLDATEIRFPNHLGIAGAVYTSGDTINIPHAYADLRFNPAFDKQTGFFTRSILCVPVINKDGKKIGVTQVLNKRGGPFTDEDEQRLKAFTAQVSIGLENASLFKDVQNIKNYNESMLHSMSNGVITLDEDGKIVTCNAAGLRILHSTEEEILDQPSEEFFTDANAWIVERIGRVAETHEADSSVDAEIELDDEKISVNLTVQPLVGEEDSVLGTMLMIEDISSEKRMKSTMSRYMDPGVADQLLAGGEDILGGQSKIATVLFSDIQGFTSLTEELGAQGTVSLLNEYFTVMVECIENAEGMLDKFIGDAIMACFGIPIARDDDEDRAVQCAISMISNLHKWNGERADQGLNSINMRIGLNTDEVVSGNIGSPRRMDYTIIGD
ncbi:MAG TPA: adenylate/guanylate cyclase domain-containing protein, partial [Rhodospirillaceae bacterium]|nr:adenylate/guanylate cyclase domain-containing protein [Rhodospirillaceae bacterium]